MVFFMNSLKTFYSSEKIEWLQCILAEGMRKYSYQNLRSILEIVGNVFLLLEKYSN